MFHLGLKYSMKITIAFKLLEFYVPMLFSVRLTPFPFFDFLIKKLEEWIGAEKGVGGTLIDLIRVMLKSERMLRLNYFLVLEYGKTAYFFGSATIWATSASIKENSALRLCFF